MVPLVLSFILCLNKTKIKYIAIAMVITLWCHLKVIRQRGTGREQVAVDIINVAKGVFSCQQPHLDGEVKHTDSIIIMIYVIM